VHNGDWLDLIDESGDVAVLGDVASYVCCFWIAVPVCPWVPADGDDIEGAVCDEGVDEVRA
jgi:hypothetical protein